MQQFSKGSIIIGTMRGKKAARHPIIYWRGDKDSSFFGIVLTHSKRKDNIIMKKEYFSVGTNNGFDFDENHPTYFVMKLFIKPNIWGPYRQVGKLTEGGINFVEQSISKQLSIRWDDYIESE